MKTSIYLLLLSIFTQFSSVAQGRPVVIEAEAAILGSDYMVVDEGAVRFIRPGTDLLNGSFPGGDAKVATFAVTFTEPGDYHVYAKIRVGAGEWGDDSFFLARRFGSVSSTNAADWFNVNGLVPVGHTISFDVVTGSGNAGPLVWKWVNISRFLNAASPVVFTVTDISTPLNFSIGARENGLDIDKIAFASAHLEYRVSDLELSRPGSPIGGFPIEAYRRVLTYIDPVLPGSHPDQTLMRVGNSFYRAGSSFHLTPYVPIYRSTDLVHWEIVSRVVPPTWPGSINDTPSGGIWQGALARFGGFFWIYYSINSQQHFSRATSLSGPWSAPVRVTAATVRGYDNSIFVDDDGLPYMLMKDGPLVNRIQRVDTITGQLTGTLLNLDWVNDDRRYSWAEGPKMVKRDGWFYYFIAGNVGGGQWTLRSRSLVQDSLAWEELGPFFLSVTDAAARFRTPNHVTQPVMLDDGTWWALSHSFATEAWAGQGRQGLLHQVLWDENGRPFGTAPTSMPRLKPNLPDSGIPWHLPRSDYFDSPALQLNWHFHNRAAASNFSLAARPGWLRLQPGIGTTHILHTEAGQRYNLVTKLDFDAVANGHEAGIYITNGNQSITARVYSGFNSGKKFGFRFTDTQRGVETLFEVDNNIGNVAWLKVERELHSLSAFFSSNGIEWHPIGQPVSVATLDMTQPSWNWWIGTNNGLFASGAPAFFDHYLFRDGFSRLPATGHENFFGVTTRGTGINASVTNTTGNGGWLMIGGVELGKRPRIADRVEVVASSTTGGTLEIWAGDLEGTGIMIASFDIASTGGETNWVSFFDTIQVLEGQHDLFLRWVGPANAFLVRDIRFLVSDSYLTALPPDFLPVEAVNWQVYPNPFSNEFTIQSAFSHSNYRLYSSDGILLLEGVIDSNIKTIDTSGLHPGVYIMQFDARERREVLKLIKLR